MTHRTALGKSQSWQYTPQRESEAAKTSLLPQLFCISPLVGVWFSCRSPLPYCAGKSKILGAHRRATLMVRFAGNNSFTRYRMKMWFSITWFQCPSAPFFWLDTLLCNGVLIFLFNRSWKRWRVSSDGTSLHPASLITNIMARIWASLKRKRGKLHNKSNRNI